MSEAREPYWIDASNGTSRMCWSYVQTVALPRPCYAPSTAFQRPLGTVRQKKNQRKCKTWVVTIPGPSPFDGQNFLCELKNMTPTEARDAAKVIFESMRRQG